MQNITCYYERIQEDNNADIEFEFKRDTDEGFSCKWNDKDLKVNMVFMFEQEIANQAWKTKITFRIVDEKTGGEFDIRIDDRDFDYPKLEIDDDEEMELELEELIEISDALALHYLYDKCLEEAWEEIDEE